MKPDTGEPYTGSCLCGNVRYEVAKLEPLMGHCHCTMCRKFHGAAFATFGEVMAENFRWISGRDDLQQFKADNGSIRQFCRRCGSSMTFEPQASDGSVIEITLGTLDTPIEERPDAHIYTDYKADWHSISDALPRFKDGRNPPHK